MHATRTLSILFVVVWLPAEELQAHYEALAAKPENPTAATVKSLVGHWSFDKPTQKPGDAEKIATAADLEPAYRDLLGP